MLSQFTFTFTTLGLISSLSLPVFTPALFFEPTVSPSLRQPNDPFDPQPSLFPIDPESYVPPELAQLKQPAPKAFDTFAVHVCPCLTA